MYLSPHIINVTLHTAPQTENSNKNQSPVKKQNFAGMQKLAFLFQSPTYPQDQILLRYPPSYLLLSVSVLNMNGFIGNTFFIIFLVL